MTEASVKKLQNEIPDRKFRLITRSDMDGLVSAVLLKEIEIIDEILFVHPKDMQDGKISVSENDITTNLPYVEGVYIAFDHHKSELERLQNDPGNLIIDPDAPSASRVVYRYFGGKKKFDKIPEEMMVAVDKADSAAFSKDDILEPEGWDLLSFIMDARTGLGRFRDFNISNYQLMMNLIDYCREHSDINEILALPDVKQRVDLYKNYQGKFKDQIQKCAHIHQNLAVIDLREEEMIWPGNRFMVYALFTRCNISCHVMWGKNKQNIVFAVGKSILNRTSQTDVGNLMLQYGGGGHEAAGTCQIDTDNADAVLEELIQRITTDG